jgi:hypothetical protein
LKKICEWKKSFHFFDCNNRCIHFALPRIQAETEAGASFEKGRYRAIDRGIEIAEQ